MTAGQRSHAHCGVQVTITAAQGGHSGPVQVLLPFGQFLLSGDWLGTIKLWDMASGQCVQTMQQAHKEPIMGVLQWEVSSPLPSRYLEGFPQRFDGAPRCLYMFLWRSASYHRATVIQRCLGLGGSSWS